MEVNDIQSKLLADLSHANAEAKKYRIAKKQMAAELEKIKSEHEKALKELNDLKANPQQHLEELQKLRTEIRTTKHKGEFTKIAKELKVREDAVDDLWALSNYKAETDVPDVDAMKSLLTEAVQRRPYLVGGETQQAQQPAQQTPQTFQAGPGLSKGTTGDASGLFRVRRADASNPEWLRINGKKMGEAVMTNSLQWLD